MARPVIAWSFSALNTFENCARKYWAVRIGKKVSDVNKANSEGDADHQSLEHYMKTALPLPPHLRNLMPLLDKIRAAPGEQYVEYSMTLDQQMTPCRWNEWDKAWVRGAGDYVKINGTQATYFDWKFGKPSQSVEDQVNLTSLLIFRHFPQVQTVRGAMMYFNHAKHAHHSVLRQDESLLWNGFISRVKEMEQAKLEDNWPTNPNPLCGWCPYKECPFNRQDERLATEAKGLKWKWTPV
jgi:hypothetical protein